MIDFVTEKCLSSANVYFKSEEMHDMDTHIGDLHPSIVGEILIFSHQQETQGQQTVK